MTKCNKVHAIFDLWRTRVEGGLAFSLLGVSAVVLCCSSDAPFCITQREHRYNLSFLRPIFAKMPFAASFIRIAPFDGFVFRGCKVAGPSNRLLVAKLPEGALHIAHDAAADLSEKAFQDARVQEFHDGSVVQYSVC